MIGATTILTSLGLSKAGAGCLAVLADPEIYLGVSAYGMSRVWPLTVALILGVVALVTWAPLVGRGLLGAFWALSAGAFARPALLDAGWPVPPIELALVPVWVLIAILALRARSPGLRLALGSATLAPLVILAALCVPATSPAVYAIDGVTYAIVTLAALCSAGHAATTMTRKTAWKQTV